MTTFKHYMVQTQDVRFSEINGAYKNQFKLKDTMLNASSKNFDSIAAKFQEEENAGSKRKWDKQCKLFFIWFLIKYFQSRGKITINPTSEEWTYFESVLKINQEILKARWITLINQQSNSICWNNEEDDIIKKLMSDKEQQHIWTQSAVELYNHNDGKFVRTPKQVRERWMNYLNPTLKKDDWSIEEDTLLLNLVVQVGKRWSHIAQMIQGRTENQVKNKYKSLINKISKNEDLEDIDEIEAIQEYLKQNNITQDQDEKQIQTVKQRVPFIKKEKKILPQEVRPKLKREAKEKHKDYMQKEKAEYIDDYLEEPVVHKNPKIEDGSIPQDLYFNPAYEFRPPTVEQMILLGLSNYGNYDTSSLDNRKDLSTPMSHPTFYQQNINDLSFFRPNSKASPLNLSNQTDNKQETKNVAKTPENFQNSVKGFKPYQQIEKSPIHQQQFQTPLTNTSTQIDLFNQLVMQKKLQAIMPPVGQSPMQLSSPYAQPNLYQYPVHPYYMPQPHLILQSPSLLNKSPYRLQNEISPYQPLYHDFQQPTPRREENLQNSQQSLQFMMNQIQHQQFTQQQQYQQPQQYMQQYTPQQQPQLQYQQQQYLQQQQQQQQQQQYFQQQQQQHQQQQHQQQQQLYQQQQYLQIQPQSSTKLLKKTVTEPTTFPFLQESNLISRWKTKQQSTREIQKI